MKIGQIRRGKKFAGYNVYEAPEGCAESYLGQATSLRAARSLAAGGGGGLPASMYDTARAAGHCAGLSAPDKSGEDDEPTAWFGRGGWFCAVAVWQDVTYDYSAISDDGRRWINDLRSADGFPDVGDLRAMTAAERDSLAAYLSAADSSLSDDDMEFSRGVAEEIEAL